MAKNTQALSASGQAIPAGAGTVNKLIVGTHSSGVIRLNDSPNSAAGRVILNDFPIPAGGGIYDLNLDYGEGVYMTLVSGTASLQLSYSPTI